MFTVLKKCTETNTSSTIVTFFTAGSNHSWLSASESLLVLGASDGKPASRGESAFCPGAASLIQCSQQTWFILSPSDQRQGFSVTSSELCPFHRQPPAGRKHACRQQRERERGGSYPCKQKCLVQQYLYYFFVVVDAAQNTAPTGAELVWHERSRAERKHLRNSFLIAAKNVVEMAGL